MSDDAALAAVQSAFDGLKADEVAAGTYESETPEPVITNESTETVVAAPAEAAPVADSAAPVVDPKAAPKPVDEEAELTALEKELVAKTPGLAKGKISVSRHQAVVTKQRTRLEAERDGYKTKAEQFDDPVIQERLKGATWAETHPEVFLREVVAKHPAYQAAFQAVIAEHVAKAAPKAEPVAAAPVVSDVPATRPEPDSVLPDGSLGYSAKAQQDLVRFDAQQIATQMTAPLLAKIEALEKGLGPVTAEREAREATQRAQQTVAQMLKDAETWDGFLEHKDKITEYLNKPGNERVKLDEAYRAVVPKALREDKATMEARIRAELVASMNKAAGDGPPRRLPNGAPPAVASDATQPRDTEDIIRAAMRSLPA